MTRRVRGASGVTKVSVAATPWDKALANGCAWISVPSLHQRSAVPDWVNRKRHGHRDGQRGWRRRSGAALLAAAVYMGPGQRPGGPERRAANLGSSTQTWPVALTDVSCAGWTAIGRVAFY